MADDSMIKIMETLGLDYSPAINSTIKFEKNITDLQTELIALKATARQTAKDINASFASELSKLKTQGFGVSVKDVTQSKVILDQYGNTLVEIGKKADDTKNKQSKLNKELTDLIHLRKTQQIDAQTFVDKVSPFRTNTSTWESLQKQEQVKLVQELTKAETEHRRVLDEKLKSENAVKAAQKETVKEIKQSALATMDADAASIQQKTTAKGLSGEYRLQATLIRNQIAELQQKLAMEGKLSAKEVKQTAQLKEQLSILKAQQRADTAGLPKRTGNILGNEFARRSSWFLTGGLFYGAINSGKEAAQTISEVESGITDIARVMEDNTFVFKDYRDELLQLGVDYGQTFDTVQDIALRWAQAGYNVSDSLENTKTSLLALNTAELDASNATESLVGIMSQWSLTSKDLPLVLDKINKTADDFTVTSQDLVDGLLRSSGAAKVMGLSLDQTISILTVMREASGRTGREVGNALNSILSYIQRPKSIDVLESMGIRMFADKAKTQFRSVMEIFSELSAKWNDPSVSKGAKDALMAGAEEAGLFSEELANATGMQDEYTKAVKASADAQNQFNDVEKRDAAQAAAGVYRRNYFIGLLERFTKTQDVLNGMTNAAGYSQAENARTMDTLEKKYESLKAAAQQLAVALGDAGLLDILKGLTDMATSAASSISKLNPEMKTLLFTALELLAAAKAIKAVGGLFGIEATLGSATKAMPSLYGKIFGVAAEAAPGWTKLIPLILAATAALGVYAYNLQNSSAEITEYKKRQDDLTDSYNAKIKAAEESETKTLADAKSAEILSNKLEELSAKEKLNNAEKAQMNAIIDQLNQTLPNLNLKIDEQTGKIIGNTAAINDNIAALRNQAIAQGYQAKAAAAGKAYVEQEILIGQTQNSLTQREGELSELNDTRSTHVQTTNPGAIGFKGDGTVTPEMIQAKQKEVQDLRDLIGKQTKELDKYNDEIESYTTKAIDKASKGTPVKTTPSPQKTSTPKTSGSSSAYENKALDNALKLLEHRKNMSEETQASIQAEIKELNRINSIYVKTAIERMDMDEKIYAAEKRLKDKRLQDSTNWINEQKELGKMSTQQEIAAWENVLKTQKNNNEAVKQATLNLYKLRTQLAEETAQKETNSIEHWAKMGIYSVQQQIDKYRELYKVKAKDQAEEYERTENLFGLYKDLLDEQQKSIKDAYDERIKQIEYEAEKKKKAQEDIIDGIEAEEKALDRLEGEHDYANEMTDLREQLAYWQVRTSEEARQKVADLNKEIAEKEHDHEVELQKQALEDKKQTAQDAIDEIEKAANAEKEKWEASYKLIEKAFDEHSLDIVAMAGTMSQQAYQKWIDNYLTPLQNALKSGNLGNFESGSEELKDSIGELPAHDWGMSDADFRALESYRETWRTLEAQGHKSANNEEMRKAHENADKLRVKYGRDPSLGEYPKFHTGGITLSDGMAALKKGEIIFPPHLSTDLKTIIQYAQAGAFRQTGVQTSTTDNRKQIQLTGPLLHVENMNMEDQADEQSLAGELARAVVRI